MLISPIPPSISAHCFLMVLSYKALNSPWCTRAPSLPAAGIPARHSVSQVPFGSNCEQLCALLALVLELKSVLSPGPLRAARNWGPSQFGRVSRDAPTGGDAGRWLAARMEIPCAVAYSRRMRIVIHGVDNNTPQRSMAYFLMVQR